MYHGNILWLDFTKKITEKSHIKFIVVFHSNENIQMKNEM